MGMGTESAAKDGTRVRGIGWAARSLGGAAEPGMRRARRSGLDGAAEDLATRARRSGLGGAPLGVLGWATGARGDTSALRKYRGVAFKSAGGYALAARRGSRMVVRWIV